MTTDEAIAQSAETQRQEIDAQLLDLHQREAQAAIEKDPFFQDTEGFAT